MTAGLSLLGLDGFISRSQVERLSAALSETWLRTMNSPISDLISDLEASRRWFDPVAQGQRLRRELGALPDLPEDLFNPGEPFVVEVTATKRVVTPEGRCALDLLLSLAPGTDTHMLSDPQLVPYDRLLGATYRDWARHRITSVLALLAGETKPLQIPAAGVVIALLVDRCTSPERALVRPVAADEGTPVERAFFNAVNAFADLLAPTRKGRRDQRLVSGWMLYEARRRLGTAVVIEAAGRSGGDRVWIRASHELQVVNVVTRDLVRGHRTRATPDRFSAAYDALVNAIRSELPTLAAFGMAHERPANTDRLRTMLLEALSANLSDEPSDLAL